MSWRDLNDDVRSIQLFGPFKAFGDEGHVVVMLTVASAAWWFEGGHAISPWLKATARSVEGEQQVVLADTATAISEDGVRTDTLVFTAPPQQAAGTLIFEVELIALHISFKMTATNAIAESDTAWSMIDGAV